MVLLLAFGLSLGLHVPLMLALSTVQDSDEPFESTEFDLTQELQVNVVEEEEEDDQDEDSDEALQHVTAPAPEREERPDKAEFLDQYESKTDRQTVRKGEPGSPVEPTQRNEPRPQNEREAVDPVAEAEQEPEDAPDEQTESSEEVDLDSEEESRDQVDESALVERERVPESGGEVDPQSLFPNFENSKVLNPRGQEGSIDYLRDVEEGDKTVLNRKRSRYWAFFDRLKLQIAQQWSPRSEYRKRDPYGNVYGVKDRYSTIRVTLNGDGSVRQLHVDRSSGLDFYDDEAIRAIRVAAPFHNPPEGLKDEDGLIHFTFGFYFEITSGSSFRIFR